MKVGPPVRVQNRRAVKTTTARAFGGSLDWFGSGIAIFAALAAIELYWQQLYTALGLARQGSRSRLHRVEVGEIQETSISEPTPIARRGCHSADVTLCES